MDGSSGMDSGWSIPGQRGYLVRVPAGPARVDARMTR
jgi:hypothetical protein